MFGFYEDPFQKNSFLGNTIFKKTYKIRILKKKTFEHVVLEEKQEKLAWKI